MVKTKVLFIYCASGERGGERVHRAIDLISTCIIVHLAPRNATHRLDASYYTPIFIEYTRYILRRYANSNVKEPTINTSEFSLLALIFIQYIF